MGGDGAGWQSHHALDRVVNTGPPPGRSVLPEDARVTFRIGLVVQAFETSAEAIRRTIERDLGNLSKFGVELQALVMSAGSTAPQEAHELWCQVGRQVDAVCECAGFKPLGKGACGDPNCEHTPDGGPHPVANDGS